MASNDAQSALVVASLNSTSSTPSDTKSKKEDNWDRCLLSLKTLLKKKDAKSAPVWTSKIAKTQLPHDDPELEVNRTDEEKLITKKFCDAFDYMDKKSKLLENPTQIFVEQETHKPVLISGTVGIMEVPHPIIEFDMGLYRIQLLNLRRHYKRLGMIQQKEGIDVLLRILNDSNYLEALITNPIANDKTNETEKRIEETIILNDQAAVPCSSNVHNPIGKDDVVDPIQHKADDDNKDDAYAAAYPEIYAQFSQSEIGKFSFRLRSSTELSCEKPYRLAMFAGMLSGPPTIPLITCQEDNCIHL